MNSLRLNSTECAIALQQLTKALEATQDWIGQWANNEGSTLTVPHNALPSNRKSLLFIQAAFEHNSSLSAISDAIDASKELQFEVIKYREETESAFQRLWYLYNVQNFCAIQGHANIESLASVSTGIGVRTLAPITSRIAECSARYTENDGELIDNSNDPIQWLQEQALRADLRPPSISAHVVSDYESEDTTSEDDSIVRVGENKHSSLTEIIVHRPPHQLIPPKIWRATKCVLPQCWSKHRECQNQMTQFNLPPSIILPHSRLYLSTTNIR